MVDELLREFAGLTQPRPEAAREYAAAAPAVRGELEAVMEERAARGDLYPAELASMMRDNLSNHFKYMESVFQLYDVRSFVETVAWVFSTYMARGVRAEYWKTMLPQCRSLLRERLTPGGFAEIAPFYEALERNVDRFALLRGQGDFWGAGAVPKEGSHGA